MSLYGLSYQKVSIGTETNTVYTGEGSVSMTIQVLLPIQTYSTTVDDPQGREQLMLSIDAMGREEDGRRKGQEVGQRERLQSPLTLKT